MKKLTALFVALAMTFITAIPALGAAKSNPSVKLDDAISNAKTLLNLKTDNYSFNYNYNENAGSNNTWDLSWSSKNNDGTGYYVSVNSETGDIISYNMSTPYNPVMTVKIPKYSREQALAATQAFLKKVVPKQYKETIEKETADTYLGKIYPGNQDTYNFNFTRQVNGLNFLDNGIIINVDKNTLAVRNFNLNWDKATFESPSKAISASKAMDAFKTKLGLELSYVLVSDQSGKTPTPMLVYSLKNGSYPIDAVTGEVLKNSYGVPEASMKAAAADSSAMRGNVVLTPQEQASVDASTKYIPKDTALATAKKYVTISSKMTLTGANLYTNSTDGSAQWNFNWNYNNVSGAYSYASASINAITGKMIGFNMYGSEYYPVKETAPSYTKTQAAATADKFLSTLEPDKFKIVERRDADQSTSPSDKLTAYNYNYVAKVNGAACSFDSMSITVNPYTGKIMSYNMSWTDVKFPSAKDAIGLNKAYEALGKVATLDLQYVRLYDYTKVQPTTTIKLAYVLNGLQGQLDANSGAQIDYNGKPIVPVEKISYSDIKGNTAENDISALVDLGIIDDATKTFNPDSPILQKDFIKMLVKSLPNNYVIYATLKDGTVDYDSYYTTAIQKNILTEAQKNPTANVTRQDAAKYILRAMGLGFVAENNSIFIPGYKDAASIDKSYVGYAAIASSLKLLPSENNQFNGKTTITRGQSASAIANYLRTDTAK